MIDRISTIYYNIKNQIRNFFYYGWNCRKLYSWESLECYALIEIHLRRLHKLAKEDKFYCWTEPKTRAMRTLEESIRLSGEIAKGDMFIEDHSELYEKHPSIEGFRFEQRDTPEYKAFMKDLTDLYKRKGKLMKERKARLFMLLDKWLGQWSL